MIEKYKDYLIFVDLEKKYHKVSREVLRWVLERKEVTTWYIDIIKYMYDSSMTSIRNIGEESRMFSITIALHQGLILSPYQFALVINKLTKCIL